MNIDNKDETCVFFWVTLFFLYLFSTGHFIHLFFLLIKVFSAMNFLNHYFKSHSYIVLFIVTIFFFIL